MFLTSAFPSTHGFPNMMTLQYGRNLEILFYNFTTFFLGGGGGGRKWVNPQLTIFMLLITFKVYLSQVTWITRSIAKMILLENHPLQKWQRKRFRYLGKTLEDIFFSLKVTRSYCIHCKLFSQFNFLFFSLRGFYASFSLWNLIAYCKNYKLTSNLKLFYNKYTSQVLYQTLQTVKINP